MRKGRLKVEDRRFGLRDMPAGMWDMRYATAPHCRKILCYLAFVTLSFIFPIQHVLAQEIRATAKVDSNNITIGDWLKVHLEVEHPANVTVTWPQLADSLQGLEIIQRGEHLTQQSGPNVLESASVTVTAYDSGTFVIPPLPFQYSTPGDTSKKTAETSPILITVHGIPVDTTKDIRDIKPPLSLSITFSEILPYLIALVLIAGLVWLLYYIRLKRQRGESLLPEAPRRPAHEVALEALRALGSERLCQRGKAKEYHSQLTDIVRLYIERRFEVMAMELTTDEILSARQISDLERDRKEQLKEILIRADLVKFAKFQPLAEENESSMALAVSFVETTWRVPEVPEQQEIAAEVQA